MAFHDEFFRDPVMKIIFLGTNGWYTSSTGNTLCILIESDNYYIVLDAGDGFHKLDTHLKKDNPVFILLSHFHLDHISGLHTLVKFSFNKALKIFGPKGIHDVLKTIINPPFSIPLRDLSFRINVLELPGEEKKLPCPVDCMELLHTSLTLGYRLNIGGKIIAFCPDTEYCGEAVKLARGADLLITECAFKPGEYSKKWPHLNPQQASNIAKEAGAKQLVLTHFDASRYVTLDSRRTAEMIAKETFPNTIASWDDMQLEI